MQSTVEAQAAADQAILCLQDVCKEREKGGNRFVLTVPSFIIQPGEFIAIVGASGCGKSTLLDMLALVLRPTEAGAFTIRLPNRGEVYCVTEMEEESLAQIRKSDIGYVLQTGGLLPFLSVRDIRVVPQ